MATERKKLVERVFELEAGEDLKVWIADQRDHTTGDGRQSWRRIAQTLYDDYGIEVTDVTLINWYGDSEREPAA